MTYLIENSFRKRSLVEAFIMIHTYMTHIDDDTYHQWSPLERDFLRTGWWHSCCPSWSHTWNQTSLRAETPSGLSARSCTAAKKKNTTVHFCVSSMWMRCPRLMIKRTWCGCADCLLLPESAKHALMTDVEEFMLTIKWYRFRSPCFI